MSAKLLVPLGTPPIISGGETSSPSHVYSAGYLAAGFERGRRQRERHGGVCLGKENDMSGETPAMSRKTHPRGRQASPSRNATTMKRCR